MLNKTRDLEAVVKRTILGDRQFDSILELGCGTGKNTIWLAERCRHLTAVDFSEAMLAEAKQKFDQLQDAGQAGTVRPGFQQADITKPWTFPKADLITCSLILEHIEDINFIFQQASKTLNPRGSFYICELHPYKQLQGSRAKFETGNGLVELEYFIHHLSDFFQSAKQNGFDCIDMKEWFDEGKTGLPRLCSFLFTKLL